MAKSDINQDADIEIRIDGVKPKYATPPLQILYDGQIILSSGEIIPAAGPSTSEQTACSHTYQNATYVNHTKDSTGGCVAEQYSADRCVKCGDIKIKSLFLSSKYVTCPH